MANNVTIKIGFESDTAYARNHPRQREQRLSTNITAAMLASSMALDQSLRLPFLPLAFIPPGTMCTFLELMLAHIIQF